jgi:hypothetical protein
MTVFLVILAGLLLAGAVISLVRGIAAFLQSTREDLERPGDGPSLNQLKQNKMMFARIKFQLGAVVVVILMAVAGKHH